MDVFEAHKYLDPTTLDDSSFLSFSSFADLTRSPYDEFLSPVASSSRQLNHKQPQQRQYIQPQHLQPQPFGLYQSFDLASHLESYSTPTPPSSHSDSGSESPSTPTPYHVVACTASSNYTPSSSPLINRGGPSRHSAPTTTPSHHVSHRSASSSSDWNSPVTPSLTYKSSVDSLASFAPEPDFFLPPSSSHTAFGWDDQSLGSSSSLTLRSPSSPPSPSPHRVASNPTLGKNRHPRSVTQVKSLPSLREEGTVNMDNNDYTNLLFDQFTDFSNLDMGNDNQDWSGMINQQTSDIGGTFFESVGSPGVDLTPLLAECAIWNNEASTSAGSTSTIMTSSTEQVNNPESYILPDTFTMAASDSTMMVNAPSLVPDLSSTSTSTNVVPVQYHGWQPETSPSDEGLYTDSQSGFGGSNCAQYASSQDGQHVSRPVTAPQQSGSSRQASSSYSLSVPALGMSRSVSSTAVAPIKSTDAAYSYTGQQQGLSDPLMQHPSFSDYFSNIDPALMGMSSTKPADLPSPPIFNSRRGSHSFNLDIGAASQYSNFQQHGQYSMAPSSAPYALQSQPDFGSVQPMSLQPGSSAHPMERVASQPLPGSRAQLGVQPHNFYQQPYNTSTYSKTTKCSEEERQRVRALNAPRKVSMEEASVMQPWIPQPIPDFSVLAAYPPNSQHRPPLQYQQQHVQMPQQPQQPQQMPMQVRQTQYMGWESPNSETPATQYAPQIQRNLSMGSAPMMTNNTYAPLNNIHPPANSFHPNPNPISRMPSAPVPHRVHPPPHPGSIASGSGSGSTQQQQPRPMARLPSGTPASRQSRKVTTPAKPKVPKTPGRKKNMPQAGYDNYGGMVFANYTPNDGQTLLKGVAPSGSQSKRKREANAALLSVPMGQTSSGSDISGDEDSRSKRSRSAASSSNAQ